MAVPVFQTISTAASTSGSTLVVSNPTGLTAGDEMLLAVTWKAGNERTLTTPSGWTVVTDSEPPGSTRIQQITYRKTATAGDVSAGSLTLTWSGTIDARVAHLLRITGVHTTPIATSEFDTGVGSGSTEAPVYSTSLTPLISDNLVVMIGSFSHSSSANDRTIAGYATTPAITFFERADTPARVVGDGLAQGTATGNYTSLSEITSRQFTIPSGAPGNPYGAIIVYTGTQNATGTNTLYQTSPNFFATTTGSTQSVNNALFVSEPDLLTQSSATKSPTQWTGDSRPSTNWIKD